MTLKDEMAPIDGVTVFEQIAAMNGTAREKISSLNVHGQ